MAKKRTVERKTAIKNSIGRITVFGLLVIAQIIGFLVLIFFLGKNVPAIDVTFRIIALIVAIAINSRDHDGVFKLIWVIVILIVPVPGLCSTCSTTSAVPGIRSRRGLKRST